MAHCKLKKIYTVFTIKSVQTHSTLIWQVEITVA